MNLPKVTIVIPTYNQAEYIKDAIKSALNQKYLNLEILISDDCSTDNTSEIVKEYLNDSRVKYFCNVNNLGMVANYRKAFYEYATGDWLLNLDGDDYLTNDSFISFAMEQLDKIDSKDISLIAGGAIELYPNGLKKVYIPENKVTLLDGFVCFLRWNKRHIPHLGAIYNGKIVKKIDLFNTDIVGADSEAILKMMLHGKVLFIDKIAGAWRFHGENASKVLKDYEKYMESIDVFIEGICNYAIRLGYAKDKIYRFKRKKYIKSYEILLSKLLKLKDGNLIISFFKFIIFQNFSFIIVFFYPKNIVRIIVFQISLILGNIKKIYSKGLMY